MSKGFITGTNEELIKAYKESRDESYLKELIEANKGLINLLVSPYLTSIPNSELEDLTSESYIPMLRAIEDYDPEQGVAFSTLLKVYVRQHLNRLYNEATRQKRFTGTTPDSLDRLSEINKESGTETDSTFEVECKDFSAPFIIPKAVQEKGLDEKSYGGNSALMKAFCDKAVPLCKKTECTFLMINQLRENIGNPYKPFKIPCGTAIAHACSQILWFTKGSLLDEKYKEVSSGYANPSGNLVSVKVEKNKVTKNDRRLQTYTLNYSTGVDEIKDTLDLAIMLGIISQAGAWYKATLKDGKEQKMQGFNGVQEFYYNDLEELEYLRKQVYEAGMA